MMEEFDSYTTIESPRYRRRLRQVLTYLVGHWPSRRPVKLVIRAIHSKHGARGYTEAGGGGLIITLDVRMQLCYAMDTLCHEWAHAVCWDVREEHHGAAWRGVYGEICTAFEDGDAEEDSLAW